MPMTDALLPEYDHEMANTRKVLERVPEDRLDERPAVPLFLAVRKGSLENSGAVGGRMRRLARKSA